MALSVELSSQTFARLQAHAVPLVDSIETVVTRLLDFYESKTDTSSPASTGKSKIQSFNPVAPPSLTHTKVLAVDFRGKQLDHSQSNWNGLLNAAVRVAKSHAKSSSDLKRLIIIPFVEGKKEDEGFRFLPDSELSIQGQDAHGAWKASCHIAQKLDLRLTVTFVWREKEKAAFPGITGRLSVPA